MSKSTCATQASEQAGVGFTVHSYDYDPDVAMVAAKLVRHPPGRFRSLDEEAGCRFRRKIGADDETRRRRTHDRLQGGGISPFGQMRKVPAAIEQPALVQDLVYINGGQRGLQVRLSPKEAARLLDSIVEPFVA